MLYRGYIRIIIHDSLLRRRTVKNQRLRGQDCGEHSYVLALRFEGTITAQLQNSGAMRSYTASKAGVNTQGQFKALWLRESRLEERHPKIGGLGS